MYSGLRRAAGPAVADDAARTAARACERYAEWLGDVLLTEGADVTASSLYRFRRVYRILRWFNLGM